MTFQALIDLVASLDCPDRDKLAVVWPPMACPAGEAVEITGLSKTAAGDPVLTTGKTPTFGS